MILNKQYVLLTVVIIVLSILFLMPPLFAQPRTCDFYGKATFEGASISGSDIIKAFDPDGVNCGTVYHLADGYYAIHVSGDDFSTSTVDEGAIDGDVITFTINDKEATVSDGNAMWVNSGSIFCCLNVPLSNYSLAVEISSGEGSVLLDPSGGTYASGAVVTLTPVPNTGFIFSSWSGTNSGDIVNTGGVYTIEMNGNKTVQANFTQITYTLTATSGGNGTVSLSPAGGTYTSGTTVTLTPAPASGYQFSTWSGANAGDIVNTGGIYTIMMNGNKTVTAIFNSAILIVDPSSRSVDSAAGNTTFNITSNINWTASDDVDWLTVSPTSGSGISTSTLCVGGHFSSNICKWDGYIWSVLGDGLDNNVFSLAVGDNGILYAGGAFTVVDGVTVNNVAKWDGLSWTALGSGMSDAVAALAVASDGVIYAGGDFNTAGGIEANYIAKWDGSAWSFLGSGMSLGVRALEIAADGALYAGGYFSTAGGLLANGVAKWDGSKWSALGSGINGDVYALAIATDGTLYAGGNFTTAGGNSANRIAKWNGSSWSALGSGMDNTVNALAIATDGTLYAGGNFTTAGGNSANRIAKWDGSSWSALGSGVETYTTVTTLAVASDGALYAGGNFSTIGGILANHIAKWDGSTWSALGSGMNGNVNALVMSDKSTLTANYSSNSSTTSRTATITINGAGLTKIVTVVQSGTHSTQNISLPSGWSMISSYVLPAEPALQNLLEDVSSNLVIMKNGKGQVYWPAYGIDQIGSWNLADGYQLYLTGPNTLLVAGNSTIPELTPLSLSSGWNLSSYLRNNPMAPETALASISPHLLIAKNGVGQIYWPAYNINTIGEMQPGQGYQIYVTAASTLTYPANGVIPKEQALSIQQATAPTHYSPIKTNTGKNAILLVSTAGFPNGAEIGAWTAQHLLVGCGVISHGKACLVIWGDDTMTQEIDGALESEPLTLTCWLPGINTESQIHYTNLKDGLAQNLISSALEYQTNAVWLAETDASTHLSPESILPIEFGLTQNYPNPFNPTTKFNYQLPRDAQVELIVYNISGAKIRTLVSGTKPAGYHEVPWNGRDESERLVPSGVYWVRMEAGDYQKTVKMSLIK